MIDRQKGRQKERQISKRKRRGDRKAIENENSIDSLEGRAKNERKKIGKEKEVREGKRTQERKKNDKKRYRKNKKRNN